MPSTVNGIGTTYYGKKNVEIRTDFCEHCHRQGNLASYDTRLWFVVVFIPIIPLGRKRVIDYCPACTKHRVTELEKWESAKKMNLAAATEKFKANPTPEAAVELHSMLMGFQQSTQAAEFRKFMREKFADHAKVQAYLGQVWQDLGKPAEAGPCFQQALRLDPAMPAAKAGMGQDLIRQGKLDEARKLLAFLEAPDAASQFPLAPINELALAYQKAGQHKEALELFQKLLTALPPLAQDKAYRKVVRASETALGAGASALPPRVRPWGKILGWSTAAFLALVGVIGSNVYIAGHRTVYLVNGLAAPVTVSAPGQGTASVGAGEFTSMSLAEGRHQISFEGPMKETVEVTIHGSFFERWFGKTAFVLNPSGAAIVIWEKTVYSRHADPNTEPDFRLHYGETFHTFPGIDLAFEPFPKTVRTKSSSETRTRIDLLRVEPVGVFVGLLGRRDYGEALRLAEWHLRLQPETNALLTAYASLAKSQKRVSQATAVLRGGLARRPVDIAWHRAYQELLADEPDADKIVQEYDALLRAEPNSSALLYLRGRLSLDQREADSFFARALTADPNNAYAHNAVGFRKSTLGDWAGARKDIGRARELRPEEPGFSELLREARLASGEFTALEQELQAHLTANPMDQQACLFLCDVFAAQGKKEQALRLVTDYERAVRARFPQDGAEPIRTVRRHLLYTINDFTGLEKYCAKDSTPEGRWSLFRALIEMDRVSEAVKLFPLNDPSIKDPWHYLATSIAWQQAGDPQQAAAWRSRAVELLAAGRREFRPVALIVRSSTPTPIAQLMDLAIAPKAKALLFVEEAQRFPAQSAELLAKARLFNIGRDYPFHLLQRVCDGKK